MSEEVKIVVSEILKEIEERMGAFELVHICIGNSTWLGENEGQDLKKSCGVAHSVLDQLHTYILDTWPHMEDK